MKLVAGLGNPGRQYAGTRHNIGFEVIDELAKRHRVGFEAAPADAMLGKWRRDGDVILLVKPLTFMNLSGVAVGQLLRYFKVEVQDLLVVCDDVTLPLGRLRVRGSGSEGGHNGLRSMAQQLGTIEYSRLRVGVGRGDTRRDLADHVLASFAPEEQTGVQDAVTRSAEAVESWVIDGLAKTMNVFNRAGETNA
ncbi:MAG: aminoacyl-tRNA hydrolase [Acidobacteria bacterium]|jgi:PTH1 family peptidyl-tRNA hydrolase|nr:aminoacyl-tRNA hydrolase [Acidobacteriota bacterium]MBP8274566.1 aminoacyl-tRNA hydrolase [Acidobacteriota bacterium]